MKLLDVYRTQTIDFVRSLVIKSVDIAEQINWKLIATYGDGSVDLSDPTTWKYYRNLYGEYTPYDTLMQVTSIEDGSTIDFTKSTLSSYPLTLEAYRTNRSLRVDLLRRYPEQALLIDGILNPIDPTIAIDADDHQILYYDPWYVEPQEYYLIEELQDYIDRYRDRWHVRGFTVTDSLYLAAYWSIFHTRLVGAVMNIRQKYARTSSAHSFFVYQYFASHHALSDIVGRLNEDVVFFLYKNLDTINRVVGNRFTLNDIVRYVLEKEGYRVQRHELTATTSIPFDGFVYPTTRLVEYGNDDITSLYEELDNVLYLETSDYQTGGIYGKDDLDHILPATKEQLKRMARLNIPTKTLKIDKESTLTILDIDTTRLIVDHWVYCVFTNKLDTLVVYPDPNTGFKYILSQKDAFVLFIYLIARKYGIDKPVLSKWDCRYIVPNIDINYLSAYLPHDSGLDGVLTYIVDTIVPIGSNLTTVSLRNYLYTLLNHLLRLQVMVADESDDIYHGILKQLIKRVLVPVTVSFDYPTTDFSTLYDNKQLPNVDDPEYDIDKSIIALLETVTGFQLPLAIDSKADLMRTILSHLTAYTTQPLVALTIRKLGNAEMGYSRLSTQVSSLFYPIIESDCLPDNTGPLIYAECGEIYFDLSSLCFDAVIHDAVFDTVNTTTTTNCRKSVGYQIQNCQFATSHHDADCIDFTYRNAGSCTCYISFTINDCEFSPSYTIQGCLDVSPIAAFVCQDYQILTDIQCADTDTRATINRCLYFYHVAVNICLETVTATPMVCRSANTDTITDCMDAISISPMVCTPYQSWNRTDCIPYDYYGPIDCNRISTYSVLSECLKLPYFSLSLECVCRI